MTAFYHLVPCELARFTHDLLHFLATIANKRCEATSAQHHAHFVIIAFAQIYALRPLLRRLRSRHDDAHNGRTHQVHIVAMIAINRRADRHVIPLGQHRPRAPAFPRSVGLPTLPYPAVTWSSPLPSSASPDQCPSVHRTVRR